MNDLNMRRGVAWRSYGKPVLGKTGAGLSVMQLSPPGDYIPHTTSSEPFGSCTHLFIVYIFFSVGPDPCQKFVLGIS